MPRSHPKKTLRIGVRQPGSHRVINTVGSLLLKEKSARSVKGRMFGFDEAGKIKQSSKLSMRNVNSKSNRTKLVGTVQKSESFVSSTKRAMRDTKPCGDKLKPSSLIEKKASSPIFGETDEQKDRLASEFSSFHKERSRFARRGKETTVGNKRLWSSCKVQHLSQGAKLELFRSMLARPSSFLELRDRFGISKYMITTLVKNGFLCEVWGTEAVGRRLELTRKGKAYVKKLERITRLQPRPRRDAIIRLKTRTQ